MKRYFLAAAALLLATVAHAGETATFGDIPEDRMSLEAAIIEEITLDGGDSMVTLKLDKVCIQGTAYLVGFTPDGIQSMAPAYRMGEPEQCSVRVRHHVSKPQEDQQ